MKRPSGMTLIELLVAMVIGLGVTLVVASVLVVSENHKRTTTSTNDADQTGSYAFYSLNRALRGAGSGLVEGGVSPINAGIFGCLLHVNSILPRATAFPAPFATNFLQGAQGGPGSLRVAPVLISAGGSDAAGSDALVLMGGSGADGGVSRPVYSSAGNTSTLYLQTTQGISKNDLVLLSSEVTANNGDALPGDCLLEEVQPTFTAGSTAIPIGTSGTYYYTQDGSTLGTMAGNTSTYVTPIGNSQASNVQFELFGVGTNYTLYSYDLLQNQKIVQGSGGDLSQGIADGVIQMNAIYGVATAANPTVLNSWERPTDTGYDIVSVMNSVATIKSIIAVRVAIVVRGEYYDKNAVSQPPITVFKGLVNGAGTSIALPVTLPDPHYRYRVFEFTVPLRDMYMLAQAGVPPGSSSSSSSGG